MLKRLILHLIGVIVLGSSSAFAKDDGPCTNLSLTAGMTPFTFGEVSLESHCFRAYFVASVTDKTVFRAIDYMIPLNRNFVFGAGAGAVNVSKRTEVNLGSGRQQYIHSNYLAYGTVIRLDYFTLPHRFVFGKYSIVGALHSLHTEKIKLDFDLERLDGAEQARIKRKLGPRPGDHFVFGLIISYGFFF